MIKIYKTERVYCGGQCHEYCEQITTYNTDGTVLSVRKNGPHPCDPIDLLEKKKN